MGLVFSMTEADGDDVVEIKVYRSGDWLSLTGVAEGPEHVAFFTKSRAACLALADAIRAAAMSLPEEE